MDVYSEKLCEQKHKQTDDKLCTHDKRLNNHSERIDKLEQRGSAVDAKIENLCEKIDGLVTTMRWFIGLIVGAFVGFFFYAAQRGLLK